MRKLRNHCSQRKRKPRNNRPGALCVAFLLLSLYSTVHAQDNCPNYRCEKDPKRIALVIGNANYTNIDPIPSAATDSEQMSKRLEELGFEVEVHNDVRTPGQFWDEIWVDFRKKLTTGDFVVFYFSGHGFSYGAHSFIAPTALPVSMTAQNVTDHAIAIETFRSHLETHSPALILFIIDACRSIAALDKANKNLVSKGPAAMQNSSDAVNTLIVYATEPGKPATGTTEPGRPSAFTGALTINITAEGKPFNLVFRKAAAKLASSTNPPQVAGSFNWSRTDPYLKPTAQTLEEEKEAWMSALASGDRVNVKEFIQLNSVSRYLTAAKMWLANNPENDQTSTFAEASPIAIDRAWRGTNMETVAIRRLSVPLGFTTTLDQNLQPSLRDLVDSKLGLVRSGSVPEEIGQLNTGRDFVASISPITKLRTDFFANSLAYSLASIDAAYAMVATLPLTGREEPDSSAKIVENIPAKTVLRILQVGIAPDESPWIKAIGAGSSSPFYFTLAAEATPQVLELGRSAFEVIVPARADSLPVLVDPQPIKAAVKTLREQGWKITWISISTAATNDRREQQIRTARMANTEYILRRSNLPMFTSQTNDSEIGERITSVSGREDLSGDSVRIRFFGVKNELRRK